MNFGTECKWLSMAPFVPYAAQASKPNFWPVTFLQETTRKPYKKVSCANATCLGALITGHSKFRLVTGECCKKKRGDKFL